jgi:protein disulfide-isomerase-like protein
MAPAARHAMRSPRGRCFFARALVPFALAALLASLAVPASANGADASDGASLDLAGVTPDEARVDASELELSGGFVPPPPGTNQVVEADAATLFSALANHTVVVAFTVSWCALCRGYQPEFARVAEAYEGLVEKKTKNPLVFATVNVDDGENRRLAKTFGVTSAPFVTVLRHKRWYVVDARGEVTVRAPKRYTGYLGAAPTAAHVAAVTGVAGAFAADDFGSDESANAATTDANVGTETIRRSKRPLRPYVEELTNATVAAYVADATKNVLVEFYAPWCGHCKRFEPFYYEVGAAFADVEDTRVARIDVDRYRDVAAAFEVSGLPSLQLFPKGYKSRGLPFKSAERRPADIVAFVKSPQVWLVEAQVADMPEWHCVAWLEAKGVVRQGAVSQHVGLEGDLEQGSVVAADDERARDDDAAAAAMFSDAHEWARRGKWLEAMETLVCLAHTKALRNTGLGSSPAMWNFLDNAKLHVENPGLLAAARDDASASDGSTVFVNASAEALVAAALEEAARVNPDGGSWESFGGADGSREEREASGFDWEAWEAFASRQAGDVPELGDGSAF